MYDILYFQEKYESILHTQRRALERLLSENERLRPLANDLQQCHNIIEDQQRRNKTEIDVLKLREKQTLEELAKLESENESLRTKLPTQALALERLISKNKSLNSYVNELQQHKVQLEDQQNQYMKAIDDFTLREKQKLEKYAQVELENGSLQKKVSELTQSGEGLKHTIKRLQEDAQNAIDIQKQRYDATERLRTDKERLMSVVNKLEKHKEQFGEERRHFKKEIDEIKLREKLAISENIKLKNEKEDLQTRVSELAQKCDEIKHLQEEAQNAIVIQKQQYENEKEIASKTIMKLCNQVTELESLRATLAQRCDEYVTQLDEQQKQSIGEEKEQKSLSLIIKSYIEQKKNEDCGRQTVPVKVDIDTAKRELEKSKLIKHTTAMDSEKEQEIQKDQVGGIVYSIRTIKVVPTSDSIDKAH